MNDAAHSADWYSTFIAEVLFPLHERLKGHDSHHRLRELEATQWLPRPRLQELQLGNLRRFLIAIGKTVPYYAARFADIGFEPANVASLSDLQRLPLLTKPFPWAVGDTVGGPSCGGSVG